MCILAVCMLACYGIPNVYVNMLQYVYVNNMYSILLQYVYVNSMYMLAVWMLACLICLC